MNPLDEATLDILRTDLDDREERIRRIVYDVFGIEFCSTLGVTGPLAESHSSTLSFSRRALPWRRVCGQRG